MDPLRPSDKRKVDGSIPSLATLNDYFCSLAWSGGRGEQQRCGMYVPEAVRRSRWNSRLGKQYYRTHLFSPLRRRRAGSPHPR
jgi:hypothetical protein